MKFRGGQTRGIILIYIFILNCIVQDRNGWKQTFLILLTSKETENICFWFSHKSEGMNRKIGREGVYLVVFLWQVSVLWNSWQIGEWSIAGKFQMTQLFCTVLQAVIMPSTCSRGQVGVAISIPPVNYPPSLPYPSTVPDLPVSRFRTVTIFIGMGWKSRGGGESPLPQCVLK